MPTSDTTDGRMQISLQSVQQLFNSLDPSPFYEKDLDVDAEHFLITWAREFPKGAPLSLHLHLTEPLPPDRNEDVVRHAITRHFEERARLARADLRELLDQGRKSLTIGVPILLAFLFIAQSFSALESNVLASLLRESFAIGGWVAMWRPMQIYLYDWWPLHDRVKLYERMAAMPVTFEPLSAPSRMISPRD